jgi:hypothetical protein
LPIRTALGEAMFLGQNLLKQDGNTYYTNPIARGGEAGLFSLSITHVANSPTVAVSVEHKNSADTSWTTAGAFSSITTVGEYQLGVSGLKEMVRIALVISGASANAGINVVLNAPSWRYY